MAEQPRNSDKFSDYVNIYYQQLTGSTGQRKTTPTPFPDLPAADQKLGFLGRFVDILSRPLRVISNPAMKIVEMPERFDKVKQLRLSGQQEAASKEMLSAVGSLLASPFTGFFSDDPKNKPYWSDIIERQVDVQNRNDPTYVDVANNVDPKIKGAAGFVGDFFLDPLWLVPGGWAAKAAKEGTRAVKGVTAASDVPVAVAKGQVPEAAMLPNLSALEQLSVAAPAMSRSRTAPQPAKGAAAAAASVPKADSFPAAQAAQKISDDLVENTVKGSSTSAESVVKSLREIIDNKKAIIGGKELGLKGELDTFFTTLKESVPAVKPGKALPFTKWVDKLSDAPDTVQVPARVVELGGGGIKETASLGFLRSLYKDTRNPELKEAILREVLEPKFKDYQAAVKAGKDVDFVANARTPEAAVKEAVEASVAATVLNNLKKLEGAERARAVELLGEGLFRDLSRLNSPKAMNRFLDDLDLVLKNTGALDSLLPVSTQTTVGRILRLFDVDSAKQAQAAAKVAEDVRNIPNVTPESTLQAAKNVSQSAETAEDIVSALTRAGYPADKIALRGGAGREKSLFAVLQEVLSSVLPVVGKNKLDKKYQEAFYPETLGRARKTDPEYLKGIAVIPKEPSTYFQFDGLLRTSQQVSKYLREDGPLALKDANGKMFKGDKLISEKERLTLAALDVEERFWLGQGLPLTFDLNGVYHQMRFTQAYRGVAAAMDATPATSRWLRFAFFNAQSGVAPTQFMEAISKALAGGSKDEILALLTSPVSRTGKEIPNALAGADKKIRMGNTTLSTAEAADKIADGIVAARESLIAVSKDNAELYTRLGLEQSRVITDGAADVITSLLNNPEALAAAIKAVAMSGNIVGDFGKPIKANELAVELADNVVKMGLGDGLIKNAQLNNNLADAVKSADPKKIVKAQEDMVADSARFSEEVMAEAERIAAGLGVGGRIGDEVPPGVVDDLFDISEQTTRLGRQSLEGYGTVNAFIMKTLDPLHRFFNARYGMFTSEMLWGSRLFFAQGNLVHMVSKQLLTPLRALARNNDYYKPVLEGSKTSVLKQAFINVQRGIRSSEGSILRKAEDDIRPMIAKIFDTTDEVQNMLLGNAFFRTGAGVDAINAVLDYNKILGGKTGPGGVFFDLDLAQKTAAQVAKAAKRPMTADDVNAAMMSQWKTWQVDDPIDFLARLNKAAVQISSEVGFVNAFRMKAIAQGVGSNTPKAGFVKIVAEGDSRYGKLLGDQPLYLHPDAAEMFRSIDNLAKSSKQFEGGFGKFVRTTIDPLTDTWKYAITLPRPGHHIRNLVGDMVLTYLAEGGRFSVRAMNNTWKLMAMRKYADVDAVKALSRLGVSDIPRDTTVLTDGIFGKMTADDLWRGLLDNGILPPAKGGEGLLKGRGVSEDIIEGKISRGLEKGAAVATFGLAARGGRMEETLMTISEGRDHFVRIQHFLQYIEKAQAGQKLTRGFGTVVDPKKISREELFELAAERIAKYHPDMSTLSVGEKKFARRLMPFYHWNRGAVQAVAETLLMNPGRIQAFPKATYNIAVAAGINPDSLYDPFPTDQMFPSFLRDDMEGPQFEVGGRYYGFKPGITTFDVLNQFSTGNPIDTFLGLANPAFKIPIELLTGTRLGTQSRIRDYSDYIDSSIPGINYAANISGLSVTGSLASLLTGGGFDQQMQFELGNKGSNEQLISVVNWLTGVGLTDYSRPNYIRFAEIEQRNKNREQRGF